MEHAENMKRRMTLSFEVFPPRTEVGMNNLTGPGGVLERLCSLHPDHISCTYGAGGTSVGQQIPILSAISACGTMPLAHLTCVGSTREQLYDLLQSHLDRGVDHVLALRGDLPVGQDNTGGDLHYATELVRFIRESFGDRFHLSVAGSPEGHIESRSLAADIAFLRMKQDEGANAIMTQLCWDMEQFKRWMDEIRRAGVILPVIVGIMPITNAASTINMALSRNACVMPRALCEIISRHWIFPNPFAPKEDPEIIEAKKAAFEEDGFAYTVNLIDEYRAQGVDGIHLYTLNKYENVARIVREMGY